MAMAYEQESSGASSVVGPLEPADAPEGSQRRQPTPSAGAAAPRLPHARAEADVLTRALAAIPPVGSNFLGFQLIAELGRGAFGRVYLARQGDLANRAVALKISV